MPDRRDLAKIHIAKKELNLGDVLYRNFLEVMFEKHSARDLTTRESEELLLHFQSLGWKPRPGAQAPIAPGYKKYDELHNRPGMANPAQLRLIEMLWMTGPGVRIKTLHALRHFLIHHFHVSDLRFIKAGKVSAILAAIKKIAEGQRHSQSGRQSGKHSDTHEY